MGLPDFYRVTISPIIDDTIVFGTGWTADLDITETEYTEVYRQTLDPTVTPRQLKRANLHIEWQMKTLDAAYSVYGKWQIGDGAEPTVWTDIGTERVTISETYEDFTEEDFYQPTIGTKKVTVRLVCKRVLPGPGGQARVNLGRSYTDTKMAML